MKHQLMLHIVTPALFVATAWTAQAGILAADIEPARGSIGNRILVSAPPGGFASDQYFTFGTDNLSSKRSARAYPEKLGTQTFLRIPVGAKTGGVILHTGSQTRLISALFTVEAELPVFTLQAYPQTYYVGDTVFLTGTGLTDQAKVVLKPSQGGTTPKPVQLNVPAVLPEVTGQQRYANFVIDETWSSGEVTIVNGSGASISAAPIQIYPKTSATITSLGSDCARPFSRVDVYGTNIRLLDGGSVFIRGARQSQFTAVSAHSGYFNLYQPFADGLITVESNKTAPELVTVSDIPVQSCQPFVRPFLSNTCANVGEQAWISGENLTPGMEISVGSSGHVLLDVASDARSASFVVPRGASTAVPRIYSPFGPVDFRNNDPSGQYSTTTLTVPCPTYP